MDYFDLVPLWGQIVVGVMGYLTLGIAISATAIRVEKYIYGGYSPIVKEQCEVPIAVLWPLVLICLVGHWIFCGIYKVIHFLGEV